jgi:hypothetical protein
LSQSRRTRSACGRTCSLILTRASATFSL